MKLQKIRGGNESSLNNKEYTIGVGLSLGNKWFSTENIFASIKWALQHSKNEVVVYVADSIHAINISVRSRKSLSVARRFALQEGEEMFQRIRDTLKELKPEDLNRITFVKWEEIVDERFTEKLVYLRGLYNAPGAFRDKIHEIVRAHVSKENRKFSDDDIHTLGSYIVEELPECMSRVPMRGIVVDAYMYPQDNQIVEFVEEIQDGKIFPEIRERVMDTEPKVLLVVA